MRSAKPSTARNRRADPAGRRPRADAALAALAELAEQAATRELAALMDGPWAPRWYWRDSLEEAQASARRMGYPDDHPAAELRAYEPTGQWVDHLIEPGVRGRAWRYRPPAAVGSEDR